MSDFALISDPNILGGATCFNGTCVPLAVLFENLADGVSLDQILEAYPTLERGSVVRVLETAKLCLDQFQNQSASSLRMLGHELDGAIIDVERGKGCDEVCLGTMTRVRDTLYGLSEVIARPETVPNQSTRKDI